MSVLAALRILNVQLCGQGLVLALMEDVEISVFRYSRCLFEFVVYNFLHIFALFFSMIGGENGFKADD